MLSTRIVELKSKEACSVCGEHKLYTNDSEKNDSVIRWHCLNCNHEFSENESQKKFRKKKEEDQKEKPSSSIGITVIALIMIVILALVLDQQQNTEQDTSQPNNQIEEIN